MEQAVKVAIMQPYFLPYIGYWQLMQYVNVFVVYDDIEYTKKGWINRNRFLLNGQSETFTLPLKKGSDFLDVRERQLSDVISTEKIKLQHRLEAAYSKAPFFNEGKSLLTDILGSNEKNLFQFIYNSIEIIHSRLGIPSKLVVSSALGISRQLKGQDRVIAICKALGAAEYVNPIGGIELYDRDEFWSQKISLVFQKANPHEYPQFHHEFVPNLSIIDLIMFRGVKETKAQLLEMNTF